MGKITVLEPQLQSNIQDRKFGHSKGLIGAVVSTCFAENLRVRGQGHHMSDYWPNLKIKSYGHNMTKYSTEYWFGSHD